MTYSLQQILDRLERARIEEEEKDPKLLYLRGRAAIREGSMDRITEYVIKASKYQDKEMILDWCTYAFQYALECKRNSDAQAGESTECVIAHLQEIFKDPNFWGVEEGDYWAAVGP